MLLRLAPPAKLFPPKEREWHPKTSPLPLYRPNLSRFGTTPRASTTSTSSSSSSSGYRKVPLGTPGAYRLIDDDTGESVIIWGDPDEERFPPKEALFSAPSSSSSSAANSPSTASGGAAAVGKFTKLKAHKVRALLARSSRGREDSSLDREGYGSSSVKSAELDCDYESETEEEEEGEGEENDPFEARDHVVSRSNFLEVLREEGEDGLLEGDSDRVSLLSSSSSSPGSVRKGGWAVDTGHTDRSKQRKRKEPFVKDDGGFFSRRSFKELGCSDDIIEALRKQEFVRPSHIQALSYAQILEGKTCVIADQSGSGKTLAYLAPLVQCLRQEEIRGIAKSTPKNPRVVILAPTAELASQVLNNCRSLSKNGVPFRSIVATGGFRQKTQLKGLQQELDVLIATPGRSLYLLKEGFLELANLKSVVLDEVDILFSDKDFEEVLQNLITCAPVMTQYLFVTATLPVDIYNKLVEVFPDSEVIEQLDRLFSPSPSKMATPSPSVTLSLSILFSFALMAFFQVSLAGRLLTSSVEKQQPLTLTYHKGHLLTGPVSVHLIWYGKFSASQRAVISDLVTSLSSTTANQKSPPPTVADWWTTTEKYYTQSRSRLPVLTLGAQSSDEACSLGKRLTPAQIVELAARGGRRRAVNVVLTAEDVAVEGFCVSRCGTHGSSPRSEEGRYAYIWVGNSASQCPGQCAWPFHQPAYGPQTPPLVAPNGDVGVDGMVINLATLLAGTATNPFGDGYFQGPKEAPLEAATACTGIYGKGAYPGYAGELLVDTVTGGSYNARGVNGRKYLLPALVDPTTATCSTLV